LLLKEVIGVFPKQQLKAACETILKVMTLGNAITVSITKSKARSERHTFDNALNFEKFM